MGSEQERPDGSWTVARYLRWDLDTHVSRHLRPSTLYSYERGMREWWAPRIGEVRMDALTLSHVQSAIDDVMAVRHLAPSTVRTMVSYLGAALERAMQNRIIDRNPAALARGPRMLPTKPIALTPDELGLWLDACLLPSGLGGYLWAGPLLAAAPLTGLRSGELRGLRWENVDLWDKPEGGIAGMIRVVEQIDSGTRHTEWTDPKSAAGHRLVPLPANLAPVLRANRDRMERHALRMGNWRWKEHDLVFPSTYGNVLSATTLADTRYRVAELANIDPAPTFNCLRHTFASIHVDAGTPAVVVAKMMGHADVNMTIRVYYDPTPDAYDAAAAVIANSYQPGRRKISG